ncbi:Nucleotide-binding universal stress protein, UspA family [Azospirillum oryzae]|uniref:Nucleotide-binding universal stress protein, UspA family n=1 Tax=Azospirillum oryzae TaxID=286727 RepID=A0A1X7ELA1_9PROT|nr:universal stress protein [Azospirillum oryzae]SMF35889.1 Nucleotide-binding universal stress protein, UspA family [Azospirillum oryzae]
MPFNDILVHVDGGDGTAGRIAMAARLAAAHGARLTGLHVRPALDIPVLAQSFAGPALNDALTKAADESAALAKNLFIRHGQPAEARQRWLDAGGDAAQTVIAHARCTDLAVVGPSDIGQPGGRRISGQIVLEAGVPVLMVPERPSVETLGQRVVVAWNASREAVRAVHDALPILRTASAVEVVIIVVKAPAPTAESGPGRELVDFLAQHGVAATVKLLVLEDAYGVSGSILARVEATGADLIVMGGFGRSRLREAMVGSTTGNLLTRSTVPLLVSH